MEREWAGDRMSASVSVSTWMTSAEGVLAKVTRDGSLSWTVEQHGEEVRTGEEEAAIGI